MRPGCLYVTFWGLKLSNFPRGTIRRRDIDAGTAQKLIQSARAEGRLRCASSDDLLAPYQTRALSRHQALCAALEAQGVPISIEDFVERDGECHYTAPLDLVQLEVGDLMIVADCCYVIERDEKGADFPLSSKIAPDSISFHLFEAVGNSETGDDPDLSPQPQMTDREAEQIRGQASALGAQLREMYGQVTALVDRLARVDSLSVARPATDPVPLEEASSLPYPCLVVATIDHFATGEGRTLGILITYAYTEKDLRDVVLHTWDDYLSQIAYVQPWSGIPEGSEGMLPSNVTSMLADPGLAPAICYSSLLHYNLC